MVRTDPMSGPPSLFSRKSVDVRGGAPVLLQIQTVLCVCMCAFLEGMAAEKEKEGPLNSTGPPLLCV